MAGVRIVTDGAADLPENPSPTITLVPARISFGGDPWRGSVPEFWRAVRQAGETPSSAPPTIEDLRSAYAAGDVCAIHVSSELSRTVAHAQEAASRRSNVHVVDSRLLSVALGLIVLEAARAADEGRSLEELKPFVQDLVDRAHLYAIIEDVDYLVRGGRAGLVTATKPKSGHRQVIAIKGHAIHIAQERDHAHAVRELLKHVRDVSDGRIQRWAVGHGDASDVDEFVQTAGRELGSEPDYVVAMRPSVGTHAGPGAIALGFLTKH